MNDVTPDRRRGFDLETELRPRIAGEVRWEHIEPADLMRVVTRLTMGGIVTLRSGRLRTDPLSHSSKWARYILETNQGGQYTGEAYVICYESGGRYVEDRDRMLRDEGPFVQIPMRWQPAPPSAWKVAICKHEHVGRGTREQERRGYHPGRCAKCGLDVTVDSGD